MHAVIFADNIKTDFALSRNQSNRSVFRISPACALREKLCGIRSFAILGHNLIPRDPQINYFGIFTIENHYYLSIHRLIDLLFETNHEYVHDINLG